jgi:hypothetical protein
MIPRMPTRRTFLGLLTAVPAFGQLPALERKGAAQHIVILGGGLAGLCSAYELLAQGHRVTLLEAQLRPGGRVRTLRENLAPGLYVEAGPEAIPGAHEITLHYAKTLGVPVVPHNVPGMRGRYRSASTKAVCRKRGAPTRGSAAPSPCTRPDRWVSSRFSGSRRAASTSPVSTPRRGPAGCRVPSIPPAASCARSVAKPAPPSR